MCEGLMSAGTNWSLKFWLLWLAIRGGGRGWKGWDVPFWVCASALELFSQPVSLLHHRWLHTWSFQVCSWVWMERGGYPYSFCQHWGDVHYGGLGDSPVTQTYWPFRVIYSYIFQECWQFFWPSWIEIRGVIEWDWVDGSFYNNIGYSCL